MPSEHLAVLCPALEQQSLALSAHTPGTKHPQRPCMHVTAACTRAEQHDEAPPPSEHSLSAMHGPSVPLHGLSTCSAHVQMNESCVGWGAAIYTQRAATLRAGQGMHTNTLVGPVLHVLECELAARTFSWIP